MYEQFIQYLSNNWPRLVGFLLILAFGYVLARIILRITKKALGKTHMDPTGHRFMLSILKVLLYVIVVIIALSQLNVDMTSLITILGVGGLAISLAVQDSLSNVAGGFIILFTHPFKVGDFIEIDSLSGTVKQINLLQTKLTTSDNKAIFIPNGQVSSSRITNYSAEDKRLLAIPVSVSYKEDIDRVKQVLYGLIDGDERILQDPAPNIYVTAYAASSIDLSVRVWVNNADYWGVNFQFLEQLKKAFDANHISIPYNQLDVHIDQAG